MMKFIFACGVGALIAVACGGGGKSGAPVAGAADTYCVLPDGGMQAQPVSMASCVITPGGDAGVIDYGATRFNAEARCHRRTPI